MNLRSTCCQLLAGGVLAIGSLAVFSDAFADDSSTVRKQNRLASHRLASRDRDHDGLPDVLEKQIGSNPRKADTDGDGTWDGDEFSHSVGMTKLEAYESGVYGFGDDGDDDDDDDDDNDDNDDNGGGSGIGGGDSPGVVAPGGSRPKINPSCGASRFPANCKAKKCKGKKKKAKKCRPVTGNPTPKPTAKPTGNPTPKPTTPPAGGGNFDANGNTTKFGIPAGMSGNINSGAPIWSGSCSGCHGSEKTNRTFGQIKSSLSIPAMAGVRLSDPQVANLVAYLNRGNR